MKKIISYSLTLILGVAGGVVAALVFVARYSEQVSNSDIVKTQLAQVIHARLITEGKGDKVVWMVEQMIETGLSKIDYGATYPGTESQTEFLVQEVRTVYRNQGKEMPPKVKIWVEHDGGLNDLQP